MNISSVSGLICALQGFHVLFLALHDWVPLGNWNDVRAVQSADSKPKLIVVTALTMAPFAVIAALSAKHLHSALPHSLWVAIAWAYGLLLVGEVQAWWWPYLFGAKAERVARYRAMFGNTAAFVPERNGIQPNALHVVLHVATALTFGLSVWALLSGA